MNGIRIILSFTDQILNRTDTIALKDSAAQYQRILMQALVFNLNFESEILLCGVAK